MNVLVPKMHHLEPAWAHPQTIATCLTGTSACAKCDPVVITLAMLYYNNKPALAQQLAGWSKWPRELQVQFEFLMFDDCSSRDQRGIDIIANESSLLSPPVRVITTAPPKRVWNIGGGAQYADVRGQRLLGDTPGRRLRHSPNTSTEICPRHQSRQQDARVQIFA